VRPASARESGAAVSHKLRIEDQRPHGQA
jgi:hypothetical protein